MTFDHLHRHHVFVGLATEATYVEIGLHPTVAMVGEKEIGQSFAVAIGNAVAAIFLPSPERAL